MEDHRWPTWHLTLDKINKRIKRPRGLVLRIRRSICVIHVFDARSIILSCVSSFDFLGHRTAGNPCKLQSLITHLATRVSSRGRIDRGPLDRHFRAIDFVSSRGMRSRLLFLCECFLAFCLQKIVAYFVKSVEESGNRKWRSVPFDIIFASSGASVWLLARKVKYQCNKHLFNCRDICLKLLVDDVSIIQQIVNYVTVNVLNYFCMVSIVFHRSDDGKEEKL